jgi:hypothetical protein
MPEQKTTRSVATLRRLPPFAATRTAADGERGTITLIVKIKSLKVGKGQEAALAQEHHPETSGAFLHKVKDRGMVTKCEVKITCELPVL